jgi:long-chain acyl-CoA synthetase
MSGLINTALGWWRHVEPRADGSAAGSNGNGDGHSAAADITAESALPPPPPAPKPPTEPWLKQLDRMGIPRTLVYPNTTLGKLLDQTAERFGSAAALTYSHRHWTWQEVRDQANRMAGGLARLGIRRGDRVVVTLPNCPEFVFAFYAIQKLGAVMVNAGPLMGVDDFQTVITLTSPRAVIGLDLQSPILCKAGKDSSIEHWIWVSLAFYQTVFKRIGYQFKLWHEREESADPDQHVRLEKMLADAPSRPPSIEPDPNRTAVLQPTGGTTGTVKLVQLSHRNFISNAAQVFAWMGGRLGQERMMAVLPMFHVYGLTIGLVTATYGAAQTIVCTRFSAGETLEMLRRYKPTIFPLVPAMCDAICDEIEKESKDDDDDRAPKAIEGLRVCISGAAPLPKETSERFMRITGAKLVEGYGLSEAGPVTHANVPGHARVGTIGLPLPDTRCKVVDLVDGKTEALPGECGELLVSGPQIMSGYFSNPEGTRAALTTDEDGRVWLHTGDVVRVDEDGYFHVQDRKKDMIIRSGLKVYPAKVERVLRAHELIADAAVIGRPDPVHTEEVVAMVVPHTIPEKRQELADSLRAYCRQHLAPYEVPAKVEFLTKLPRSALGKLLKKELRAMPPLSSSESNGNGNGHPHHDDDHDNNNNNGNGKPHKNNGKPKSNGRTKEAA